MKLIISGQEELIQAATINIAELLEIKKVEAPEYVTVELNDEILPRNAHNQTYLREGDKVEFLYFMGGGNSNKRDLDLKRILGESGS